MSKAMKMNGSGSGKKAVVHVLGCKVNQAESAALARILEDKGYEIDPSATHPDLVLINTCCVTARAEGKSRRFVARLAKLHPEARLVVTGCLAEINPASLEKIISSAVILGTYEKDHFSDFLDHTEPVGPDQVHRGAARCREFGDLGTTGIPGRARAFLKIQDGCSQVCSYCIVPRARGPSRSLLPEKVIVHAAALESAGHSEIVLTGIHLGSYGRDLRPAQRLEDILVSLMAGCHRARFRLSSVEPQEISDGLIELAAADPRVCRHFHIPLQSGDDDVLRLMRRPYDSAFIEGLAGRIRGSIPDACIGFDVMVGFPGEDEASFRRTVGLIRRIAPAYLHVFPFSPRPGTAAAGFKSRVPAEIARKRVEELRSISRSMRKTFHEKFVGRNLTSVAESEPDLDSGTFIARTDNYIPVRVKCPVEKSPVGLFSVTLKCVKNGEVSGELVESGLTLLDGL